DNMIPLFLGADVVAKTGGRTENHPKIHAKFGKRGLATKLIFGAGKKFRWLPSGVNSLWFYSIQGVFRVAFEMYSREDQLAVLDSLQDLWKTRINDNLLTQAYDMKTLLGQVPLQEVTEQYELNCLRKAERVCEWPTDFLYNDADPYKKSVEDCCENTGVRGRDHTYCMSEHIITKTNRASQTNFPDETAQDTFSQRIQSLFHISEMEMDEQTKVTIILIIEVIELLTKGTESASKLAHMIPQLLSYISELIAEDGSHKGNCSVYSNCLLHTISSWLGCQFFFANASISKRVEEFKERHIDRITDLPPAEELVNALFPQAMKILLLNWMGLNEDSAVWKRQSEYPILLLILEFANHNLITGVAHVLYSSLISK
uniref:Si:ch211-110p13.9 n=1 Tax=Latimeria chalumnae TaxID=7897 RepID=H3BFA2_LATCH